MGCIERKKERKKERKEEGATLHFVSNYVRECFACSEVRQ